MIVNCGTFHGGIAATTPTGSWRTIDVGAERAGAGLLPGEGAGDGQERLDLHPRRRRLGEVGEGRAASPSRSRSSRPCRPSLPAYRFEKFWTTSIRSSGVIRGHGPVSKARRAAATAASMSALLPSGTVATTCSVCGETTWIVSPVAGAAQSPSMKKRAVVEAHADLLGCGRRSGGEGEEVGEAGRVVAADAEVLEEAAALGAVQVARPTWSTQPNMKRPCTASSAMS